MLGWARVCCCGALALYSLPSLLYSALSLYSLTLALALTLTLTQAALTCCAVVRRARAKAFMQCSASVAMATKLDGSMAAASSTHCSTGTRRSRSPTAAAW